MGALRDEIARLIGLDGLAALSAARGGRRMRIPCRIPDGHWLEGCLGREAANRLAFRFGGCRLYVPLAPPATNRDKRIRELHRRGRSVTSIAAETGLSDRRVIQIIRAG